MLDFIKKLFVTKKAQETARAKRMEDFKARQQEIFQKRSRGEIESPVDKKYKLNYEKDHPDLKNLQGLGFTEAERNWADSTPRFKIAIDNETTEVAIQTFLDTLPASFQITFFDFFYPQLTDPGAYVVVQKHGYEFLFFLTNHGWSTEWKKITGNELIEYIYKNRAHNANELTIYRIYKAAQEGKRLGDY